MGYIALPHTYREYWIYVIELEVRIKAISSCYRMCVDRQRLIQLTSVPSLISPTLLTTLRLTMILLFTFMIQMVN